MNLSGRRLPIANTYFQSLRIFVYAQAHTNPGSLTARVAYFLLRPMRFTGKLTESEVRSMGLRVKPLCLDSFQAGARDLGQGVHLKLSRTIALILFACPLFAQFSGPSILSRGEAPTTMTEHKIKFRPYLGLTGRYSSGLLEVGLTETGDLVNSASYGGMLSWGIAGMQKWKRTTLGLDYSGSGSRYNEKPAFGSIEQSFLLGVTHQFSRHIGMSLRESAGVFSRNFGLLGLSPSVQFDPTRTSYVPKTDYFDNRTIYSSTQADLTIQKSSRLSFSMGGDFYIARRRSAALNGNTGETARADVQRRMTRMTTIGGGYSYQHQTFSRTYGAADVHSFYGSIGHQLTHYVELTGYGGFTRLETTFIQLLPTDPAIAALLGVSASPVVSHNLRYSPTGGARISKVFKTGVVFASGGRSVTPGNGLFLTSYSTSGDLGYNFTGLRHWSLSARAEMAHSTSLGTILGDYDNRSAGVALGRQLSTAVQFTATYSVRKYSSVDFSRYNRVIQEISAGIRIAAGSLPLKIW
jgi:hypothetical protein